MQLNQPEVFFNVVNSIGFSAADSWPLHRLGGAFFNGYVFLSTPRDAAGGGYYLDLEVNPFGFLPGPDTLALPGGITWGLPGGEVVQGRILSRVEAFNAAAPTVLWVETCFFDGSGPVQTATFKSVVPPFGMGSPLQNGQFGPLPPAPGSIQILTFEGQPAQVLDFTTASADGLIYLFWTVQGQDAISWAQFDGNVVTPLGQLAAIPGANTIFSIDATAVQMTDATTGEQFTRLAVVAMTPDGPNDNLPNLTGWLFDLAGTMLQQLDLPALPVSNPGDVDAFSSTIRTTWGSLAAGGTDPSSGAIAPANGLVLAYVPSHGDADFDSNAPSFVNINAMGPLWLNQFDLTGGSGTYDWTSMQPDPSVWGAFSAATSGPLSVLFPIPLPLSTPNEFTIFVGNAAAAQALTLFPGILPSVGAGPQFYLNVLSGFQLAKSATGTPTGSGIQSAFNHDDIVAAIGSWTLIGVVTGLPPYYPEQPAGTVSFSYTLNTESSTSSSLETSKTVTVGGTVGPVTGSFAQAVVMTDDSSTDTSTEITLTWTNDPAALNPLAPDRGVAIFWQPDYQSDTYSISNALAQPAGLTLSMLWASGPGAIRPVQFCLTDLNTPADDSLFSSVVAASFPSSGGTSAVSWPRSDAPGSWTLGPPPLTEPIPTEPPAFPIAAVAITESLQFGTTQSTSVTNAVTISLSAEATLFGDILGIETSGEISFASTVTTVLGQTQTFTIEYGGLPHDAPVDGFEIRPILLQPTADGAGWIPVYNTGQRPWLLTWVVDSVTIERSGGS